MSDEAREILAFIVVGGFMLIAAGAGLGSCAYMHTDEQQCRSMCNDKVARFVPQHLMPGLQPDLPYECECQR